jgi:MFS transporter, MHS family, proline/betaine transporter
MSTGVSDTHVNHSSKKELAPKEKEAIWLLSIGTFLEYFDVQLYIHMISTLNVAFFPASELWKQWGKPLGFCSTYIFRPIGGIIFGFVGDKLGRKVVVVITTMMMAVACGTIALLPTYAQIGITASFIATICRMVQGVAAANEITASEVYLTELIDHPFKAPAVSILAVACVSGGTFALVIASFASGSELAMRGAFMLGAIIALVGARARLSLKESRAFADAARRQIGHVKTTAQQILYSKSDFRKTVASFFVMQATWAASFYFGLMYCGDILGDKFGYNATQIARHNLVVALGQVFAFIGLTVSSYYYNPMKILRIRIFSFAAFLALSPYLMPKIESPIHLMLVQLVMLTCSSTDTPATAVTYIHFPVLRRFKSAALTGAVARLSFYLVSSFGLKALLDSFPSWGLLILLGPLTVGTIAAIKHLDNMNQKVATMQTM